jgi:hypothetical protein
MIRHSVHSTSSSGERALGLSNLVLFFSLPFKPAGSRNVFFSGHIALGVEGTVYQVYDPKALKADFLFSRMPARDWLFGDGGSWVDRDPSSPRFTHVYLYGACESRRTVVYYAGIEVAASFIRRIKASIIDAESRFKAGGVRFSILADNCSSIVAAALSREQVVPASPPHRIPVRLFKIFVSSAAKRCDVRVGKLAMRDRSAFELHRYCIGVGMSHPEKAVDRWIAAEIDRQRTRAPFWPTMRTTAEAPR